jgi:hypothetical protein
VRQDRVIHTGQIEGAALIGIDVAKEDDLGEWYQQVITKGQMISYYDVSSYTVPYAFDVVSGWLTFLGCWMVNRLNPCFECATNLDPATSSSPLPTPSGSRSRLGSTARSRP